MLCQYMVRAYLLINNFLNKVKVHYSFATQDKYNLPSNPNRLSLVCLTLCRLTKVHASQNRTGNRNCGLD